MGPLPPREVVVNLPKPLIHMSGLNDLTKIVIATVQLIIHDVLKYSISE